MANLLMLNPIHCPYSHSAVHSHPATFQRIQNIRHNNRCNNNNNNNNTFRLVPTCRRRPMVVRLFGGGPKNEDAARKALEDALSDRKQVFLRWDKEIRRKEGDGSGGGTGRGGGRGGNGGNGWFNWFGNESWKDIQQALLAIGGLILLYLLIAKGKFLLIISINSVVLFLRGFRDFFESLASGRGKRPKSRSESSSYGLSSSSAISNVVRKWGPD